MPVKALRLLNQTSINLQGNPVSGHILQLPCFLEIPLLTAAIASNNMLHKLVPRSRGSKIENRYYESLDGVLYA